MADPLCSAPTLINVTWVWLEGIVRDDEIVRDEGLQDTRHCETRGIARQQAAHAA